MGAIVDTLRLGQEELDIFINQYPDCILNKLTTSDNPYQDYRLIVPNAEEDDYYTFLLENLIATSSNKFIARVRSDTAFASKVRTKMEMVLNGKK